MYKCLYMYMYKYIYTYMFIYEIDISNIYTQHPTTLREMGSQEGLYIICTKSLYFFPHHSELITVVYSEN